MPDRDDARTHYEAANDVRYAVQLWVLHERFYDRAVKALTFLTLLLATAAVGTVVKQVEWGTAALGLVLAFLAVLNHAWAPQRRLIECAAARKRYLVLEGQVSALSMKEIDAELARLRAEDPIAIEALRPVAYNCLMRAISRESYALKLGPLETFFFWVA